MVASLHRVGDHGRRGAADDDRAGPAGIAPGTGGSAQIRMIDRLARPFGLTRSRSRSRTSRHDVFCFNAAPAPWEWSVYEPTRPDPDSRSTNRLALRICRAI